MYLDSAFTILDGSKNSSSTNYFHLLSIAYQAKGITDSVKKYNLLGWEFASDSLKINLEYLGEYYYIKGWVCYKGKQIDSARFYNQLALARCDEAGFDSLKVLVLKNLGNISLMEPNFSEASNFYDQALSLEKKKREPSLLSIAVLYQNKAIIFASTGNLDSAKLYFANSLDLKERILSPNDISLANGYINFSNFLRSTGDPNEALKYINKAEQLFLANYGKDYPGLAPVYQNKGSILIILNDYEDALIYNELAYNAYQNYLSPDDKTFISLNYNIGTIHESLGNYAEAIRYHLEGLNNDLDPEQRVKILRSLGSCYSNMNDDEKANHYYRLAIKEAESKLGVIHDQTALCYLKYGYFCDNLGELDKGLDYLTKAYNVYLEIYGATNRDVSNVLTAMGTHYQTLGKYEYSLEYFQNALNAFLESYHNTDYYDNPDLSAVELDLNIFNTLYGKSFSFYGLYEFVSKDLRDLKVCLNTIDIAINYYENFKTTLNTDKVKLLVATRVNNIYNLAVQAASELYFQSGKEEYLNLAFSYSEKSKSQVLLSSIRESEAIEGGMIPPDLKQNEQSIKKEIALLDNMIFEEKQQVNSDSLKISILQKDLYNEKLLYDSLIASLETNYPVYFNLKYNFDVIPIERVKKQIDKDQILIEFKQTDSILFAFIIDRDTAILQKTKIDSTFSEKVERFIGMMNTLPLENDPKESSIEFSKLGLYLYRILFKEDFDENHHLIIIPDDVLGYLSFDALVTNPPDMDKINFRNLSYLIEKHTICYDYSATLFFKDIKRGNSSSRLLAMAPTYKDNHYRIASNEPGFRDIDQFLTPLYHTQEEVNRIHETFTGKIMAGKEATEHNFKENASKYSILHFAMHTLINDENPFASKLVFSSEEDTIDDGFLNIYEIYNLNLNAEMAVLSACKTGVGKLSRGEGIMSLARGFLYAGVPGIVMTLWAIEDVSSMEIVTQFYKNLKKGMKKDEALREAKINYLNNADQLRSHPYFWAAYVQIGDNSPLSLNNNLKSYSIAGGIILVIIISIVAVLWRRKQRTP
ncbi:MAG: CHAT domain-containing protein [Bacteroidetes bacterium]|nr:CHAT domain-containing protein [Bacteroidota bacterium]